MQKVLAMNNQHSQAIYYLGLMAEESGKHTLALTYVSMLNDLDEAVATQLEFISYGH